MATKAKPKKTPEYVTVEKFSELEEAIKDLTVIVKDSLTASAKATADVKEVKASVPETPLDKEIKKAGPKEPEPVNSEWKDIAQEIIGEALDHVEVNHLRNGGLLFTVVIKKEFSNAPDNYLSEHKEDRRTKEIGAEGIGGVENWCKLIKQNLARPKQSPSRD